ncbi:chitinase [Mucor ambiguus]|uniref:Chitinase n=1 Tax=Mucor ambiguus TaxID=91626 RepID=A0A0C9MY69_9FUNG|nr:chitinase [Mucor ambiguus]
MRLSLIAAALASAIALCEGSTKMVIGYFPNWLYANYPVENIPFSKYTHINYAFAILNNPDNLPSFPDDWAVESSLPKVVEQAHASKTKVLLSVGGWTGSKRFSPMVATASSRKKFIDWNLDFIEKYKTDGVDIDWEYPGKQAAGCNEVADNDADNFLLLLKELRQALDKKFPKEHKEISMAVHVQPFIKSGVPMTDLKSFVPYFDHVNLMTYDINGAWATTTGPNAPFQAEEGKGAPFSFVESIRDWKKAGVPADKITAGLAFYGRAMKAQVDMRQQRTQFQASEAGAPKGDSDDAYWTDPYCNKEAGGLSGIWKWTNLRKEGLLQDDMVTPGKGWERNWDQVSQTPWLFNPETKHFISYDDPESLNIKVEHAICEDLAGVMVWDIHQDNGELLEVVNKIHTAKPASCEALLKNKSITESNNNPDSEVLEDPEEDVQSEVIDDLGDWVAPPSTTLAAEETKPSSAIAQSSALIDQDDEAEDEYEDEDEDEDEDQNEDQDGKTSTLSSSEAPTATVPVEDGNNEADGTSCAVSGQQKCASSGKTGKWLTCNIDKWIVRDCAAGLVCKELEGGIYCDSPDAGDFKAAAVPDAASAPNVAQEPSPIMSVLSDVAASLDEALQSPLPVPELPLLSKPEAPLPSISTPELLLNFPDAAAAFEPSSDLSLSAELPPVAAGLADEASQASIAEQAAHPMVGEEDLVNGRQHQASLAVENPILAAQIV